MSIWHKLDDVEDKLAVIISELQSQQIQLNFEMDNVDAVHEDILDLIDAINSNDFDGLEDIVNRLEDIGQKLYK